MPRVREFEPEQALADAMQVFWKSGYADTSMEDIVNKTGVSRYGLYGTFGNKKDLLVASMRLYEKSMTELMWSDLRKPDAGRAEIFDFWKNIRIRAQEEGFPNGCLIVNIAAEVAPHEPEIAAEVQRIDTEHASVFSTAIKNAQKSGDVSLEVDADGLGRLFVSMSRGLALQARAGANFNDLSSAVDAALSILGPAK